MRLCDNCYEELKQEVTDLFTRCHVNSLDYVGAPLVRDMGISLIPYSTLAPQKNEVSLAISDDGFYMEHEGQEYIFYNDQKPKERTKWTIMHELAHCILGHTADMEEAEREAEADFFAKYALAPPPLVHQHRAVSWQDISDLCGLSVEASCNAFKYYNTWLMYGAKDYQDYELDLLQLFGFTQRPGQENSIRPKRETKRENAS